jgi:hypothetical protein
MSPDWVPAGYATLFVVFVLLTQFVGVPMALSEGVVVLVTVSVNFWVAVPTVFVAVMQSV